MENCLVPEARKVFYKKVDKSCGRVIGAIDAFHEAAVEILETHRISKGDLNIRNHDISSTNRAKDPACFTKALESFVE